MPFFNRIRKQLARDNKFFQYSRYAIGEILLVVIGILIALQINEYQEGKTRKQKGLELLMTVRRSMQRNLEEHHRDLANVRKSYLSSLVILEAIEKKNEQEDTLLFHLNNIDLYTPFFPDYMGYEALKQGGLERIVSKDLEYRISYYYEGNSSRMNFFQAPGQYNPSDILYDYVRDHFEVQISFDIDSVKTLDMDDPENYQGMNDFFDRRSSHKILPRNLDFVLEDPEFKFILTKAIQRAVSLNHIHVRGIRLIQEIDSMIAKEISGIERKKS